jgi:hypothetical protein
MKSRNEKTFLLAFSSLAEQVRGGPQRSRARRSSGAARANPLTARTAVNASSREEKAGRLMELNSYLCGGSYDE